MSERFKHFDKQQRSPLVNLKGKPFQNLPSVLRFLLDKKLIAKTATGNYKISSSGIILAEKYGELWYVFVRVTMFLKLLFTSSSKI